MYYTYILKNHAAGRYYVGYSPVFAIRPNRLTMRKIWYAGRNPFYLEYFEVPGSHSLNINVIIDQMKFTKRNLGYITLHFPDIFAILHLINQIIRKNCPTPALCPPPDYTSSKKEEENF